MLLVSTDGTSPMKKNVARLLLVVVALGATFALTEVVWRNLPVPQPRDRMYFRDAERAPFGLTPATEAEELAFLLKIEAPWPNPGIPAGITTTPAIGASSEWFGEGYAMPRPNLRKNVTWLPNSRFSICYTGARQDYFDTDGCVEYRFNRFGIRDREDLTLAKPANTKRVVCLGDSFTLGWGVRQEHNWPVLVERELATRAASGTVQLINCGGAGSAYVDEYALALQHRHGRFQPDVVLVTLCLNDLLVTNGKLCQFRTAALPEQDIPADQRGFWRHSRLLADLARTIAAQRALDLDPARDWVGELMQLPSDHIWYRNKDETPQCYWVAGTPQRSLRNIRDWCKEHGAVPAVAVWPFLQGLEPSAFYPFAKMHQLVREFCAQEGLLCLDLLPALQGQQCRDLWVSPADMHPNERAQTIVAPRIAEFLAAPLGLR